MAHWEEEWGGGFQPDREEAARAVKSEGNKVMRQEVD